MARIRSVKPELPHDAKLAQVSLEARYTFVLLWTVADDHGYFRASPRWLLGALYPNDTFTAGDLQSWLDALEQIGVLSFTSLADGSPVGRITNWAKHQRIDNAAKSFLADQLTGRLSLAESRGEPRQGAEEPGGSRKDSARSLESRSPEPRVLSPEPLAALRARLPAAYHDALDGYLKASPHPDAVVASILAEGPDTGTNASPGKTWDVIGRALLEMRASGKPFTPALLRAFCRRLVEQPSQDGATDAERMRQAAERERAREAGAA